MKNKQLLSLPSVSEVLRRVSNLKYHNDKYLSFIIKQELELYRKKAKSKKLDLSRIEIVDKIVTKIQSIPSFSIRPVINGTGIVLHTGLGRAPISQSIAKKVSKRLSGYVNLEYDLETGKRSYRQDHVNKLLSSATGSESAMIVNNNAAAVLLALNELADGKEVIVSRGQLVEIGGSFRMPDIIAKSGAIIREVGSTNRTHLKDYEDAINKNTGLILWVHTSNYIIKGYTSDVEILDLVKLGKKRRIPVMSDLGCGEILDLSKKGVPTNLLIQDVVKTGSDLITFSGDKLLGGPQSGIIIGKKILIKRMAINTLARTVRCDKWTLAIMQEILRSLRVDSLKDNLSISLIATSRSELEQRAKIIFSKIPLKTVKVLGISIQKSTVEVGSGTLPGEKLESIALRFSSSKYSASSLSSKFRKGKYPVVGYIKNNFFYIDFKSIIPGQEKKLIKMIIKI